MLSYQLLSLIEIICLIVAGLGFAFISSQPRSKLGESLHNWILRLAILGWIGSVVLQIIFFPKQWGSYMRSFIESVYGK